MTKFLNISTDNTLGGNSPSDETVSSQKAIKGYVDTGLNEKQDTSTAVTHTASTAVGGTTQPVYIASNGTATATTYSLGKSVPADAVFTDTTYSVFTGATGYVAGSSGLVKAPTATDNNKFLRGDCTWSDALENKATGTNSLTLLGNATSINNSINIGYNSSATVGSNNIAIGKDSSAVGSYNTVIGDGASTTTGVQGTVALGKGVTASISNSFYVALNGTSYLVLTSSGKILSTLLMSDETPTSESINPITSGAVYTALSGKQDTLVSGTNIKTINNESLLGSGNITISGGGDTYINGFNLFDFKWSDHQLNDISWLRADTFSWQDGTVYTTAYQHLIDDINGKTSTTETIGSYTIRYYLADDGHKIVLSVDAANVENVYNETGVAWYYILDETNHRFKLPRTKFGFTGLRNTVGNYIAPGLPNITGILPLAANGVDNAYGGAFYETNLGKNTVAGSQWLYNNWSSALDASLVNSIYGNSYTVQPPATQMYLYFYVGEYAQPAIEQTAGLNASLFNGKMDLDMSNMNPSQTAKQTVVGWGMPDFSRAISVTPLSSGSSYTARVTGWVQIIGSSGGNRLATLDCYNSSNGYGDTDHVGEWADQYPTIRCMLLVSEGDTYSVTYWNAGISSITEIPMKGT